MNPHNDNLSEQLPENFFLNIKNIEENHFQPEEPAHYKQSSSYPGYHFGSQIEYTPLLHANLDDDSPLYKFEFPYPAKSKDATSEPEPQSHFSHFNENENSIHLSGGTHDYSSIGLEALYRYAKAPKTSHFNIGSVGKASVLKLNPSLHSPSHSLYEDELATTLPEFAGKFLETTTTSPPETTTTVPDYFTSFLSTPKAGAAPTPKPSSSEAIRVMNVDETSGEAEASPEKITKAHKLGQLVSKASVQLVKVLDKVVTSMGVASMLVPGTDLNYDTRHLKADAAAQSEVVESETTKVVEALEKQGYVKEAPYLRDQIKDKSRTNTFKSEVTGPGAEITEYQGLRDLDQFLEGFIEQSKDSIYDESLRAAAEAMREDLTFIGSKEYAEAAKGLGTYWKAYLDGDSKRQLCVLTKISAGQGARKSDVFLREMILDGFSDDELDHYSGRIVTEVNDITAKPEQTKVVLLDDWTISGSQMRSAVNSIRHSAHKKGYADRIEVNLLVAARNRIEDGLITDTWDVSSQRVPVRAYYMAHDAPTGTYNQAHISGTHSSVDYDFNTLIDSMVSSANGRTNGAERVKAPTLAHVTRAYRNMEPLVVVDDAGKITRTRRRVQ